MVGGGTARVRARSWWDRRATAGCAAASVAFAAGSVLLVTHFLHRHRGWRPIDLEVYRAGGRALLHGRDLYTIQPPGIHLPFTYPPFAAVSFVPLALAGGSVSRAALTVASLLALVGVLALSLHAVRPEWTVRGRLAVALLAGAAVLFAEPVRSTLSFGQINLLLMALVVADVLPARTVLPRGVLVGLATAVKLTPGIVMVYLLATRRYRAAGVAAATAGACALLGAVVAPGPSWQYWSRLAVDPRRVGRLDYVGNQSLRGAVGRLADGAPQARALLVPAVAVVLVAGLAVAARAARAGEELLGIGACAMTGLLVSPVSWNHHWVWAVPVGVALWAHRGHRRVAVPLAVTWTALFYLAPIWWQAGEQPGSGTSGAGAGAGHGGLAVAGNSYVLGGLLLLAAVGALAPGRAPEAGRGPVAVGPAGPLDGRAPSPLDGAVA